MSVLREAVLTFCLKNLSIRFQKPRSAKYVTLSFAPSTRCLSCLSGLKMRLRVPQTLLSETLTRSGMTEQMFRAAVRLFCLRYSAMPKHDETLDVSLLQRVEEAWRLGVRRFELPAVSARLSKRGSSETLQATLWLQELDHWIQRLNAIPVKGTSPSSLVPAPVSSTLSAPELSIQVDHRPATEAVDFYKSFEDITQTMRGGS